MEKENIDLNLFDKNVSEIIRNLGFEGNIELLLNIYKKEKIHNVIKEEIELALFNSVTSCVKKLDFEKLQLLIKNPEINNNLRLHAKMSYDNKKFFIKNEEIKNGLGCKKFVFPCNKDKLKNTGN